MNKEEIKKRIEELNAQLEIANQQMQNHVAYMNSIKGASLELTEWLKKIEDDEKSQSEINTAQMCSENA